MLLSLSMHLSHFFSASAARGSALLLSNVAAVTAMGFTPTLGLSFALGRLRGSLGAFLALTGQELTAQDLV